MVGGMKITISKLSSADVGAVDDLMKLHSGTIGFLPRVVLEDHLKKEWVLGATTQDGQLAGYLLYDAYPDRFRIVQLCVSEDFRNQGIARKLLEALKATTTTQKAIRLNCRNDFQAHSLWPQLGFIPVTEKPGRSKEGHLLTAWRLTLALGDQLALFRENISDDILDVVIDAQILFDFDRPNSDRTQPSKALISDSYIDSINLFFTDELLVEISRNRDAKKRNSDRARASQFTKLEHAPRLLESRKELLRQILPSNSTRQQSDINHIAKAASSNVNIFVTRDQALLKKANQIAELLHLQVLSPAEVIMQLRELSEKQAIAPDRVSGFGLEWRRLNHGEFAAFPFRQFLDEREKLNQFRRYIDSLLVSANHELQVLWSESKPVALRVLSYDSPRTLTVSLGRVSFSQDRSLFGRFLVSDVIYKAIQKNLEMVKLEASALPLSLVQGLSEMGYTKCDDVFIRFCFARALDRADVLSEVTQLSPECTNSYQDMSDIDLERSCSPLASMADQNYFLISIRQGYALNLFDRQQSAQDMFGGNQDVLLRWSNVYYRAANFHRMFKAPGRILWYVSGHPKNIVAISHLDEVVIDTPKELYRRFRKYGTLEWKNLYEMCNHDISKELMALRFSHTFPLQKVIPLKEMYAVFDEDGIAHSMQAPKKITSAIFLKLFQLGYREQ